MFLLDCLVISLTSTNNQPLGDQAVLINLPLKGYREFTKT